MVTLRAVFGRCAHRGTDPVHLGGRQRKQAWKDHLVVLDAETRSVPRFARTEHQTSASPADGWSHLIDKCGTRA